MSKEQYNESMIEITGNSESEAQDLGKIPKIIALSSQTGLKLLQVQFKVFLRYIEKRLDEKK